MYKKGFTLVELLAVIVILSIIALITIVSVNSVIKDSKDNLSETQKKNIEKAAEAYYLKEGMDSNVSCVSVSDLISKGYLDENIKDPKDSEDMTGSVKITFVSNQYLYEYQTGSCESLIAVNTCKAISSSTSGSYTRGDKYSCAVSSTETYNFYVLSDNGDDTVTLLMGQNLGSNIVPWGTIGNVEGSISSTEYLENQTDSWTITKDIALPSALQVGCSNYNFVSNSYCNGSIPTWAQGVYWTSTIYSDIYSVTDQEYGYSTAFYVNGNYIGFHGMYDESGALGGQFGIRPIITVEKNKLK